jgi:DNA-binding winged helix-turn-helix (wHTH) protein/cytochrome c-type biogenesis protein CcmH/NrfG
MFPPFALDAGRHVLEREGVEQPLSPHLVDILQWLVEHRGALVAKDDLLDRFWPDVHVTENTLTRAIADIRKALGDDPRAPRYIQTVARRGYRFVAPVEPHPGPGAAADEAKDATPARAAADPFREWVKGRLSLEALDATQLPETLGRFERALASTPGYAPAHAALASASFMLYEQQRAANVPDRAPLERARSHARRACELDPTLGEAWATLGFILTAAGEVEEARAAARHAAQLEPSNWRHHFRLGIATWGEERLRAVDRTLGLLPDFAPARFLEVMVFVARHAFRPATAAAAAGAAAQSRQRPGDGTLFPAIGLHWLHGLLLLRDGQRGAALQALTREIDDATDARIYGVEFRINALIAAGFAHLDAGDAGGAVEAFRWALDRHPRNGRALVGLSRALARTSAAHEVSVLTSQIEHSIGELRQGGRQGEAALVTAAARAGRDDLAGGCAILHQLLDAAPPGQTGWLIPIDPALAPLRAHASFADLLTRLAARAA